MAVSSGIAGTSATVERGSGIGRSMQSTTFSHGFQRVDDTLRNTPGEQICTTIKTISAPKPTMGHSPGAILAR